MIRSPLLFAFSLAAVVVFGVLTAVEGLLTNFIFGLFLTLLVISIFTLAFSIDELGGASARTHPPRRPESDLKTDD